MTKDRDELQAAVDELEEKVMTHSCCMTAAAFSPPLNFYKPNANATPLRVISALASTSCAIDMNSHCHKGTITSGNAVSF